MYYTVDSYYDVNTKITDVNLLKFISKKDLLILEIFYIK
jgi:hypothetical protein